MRLRIFIPVEIQFTQGKLYKADKQSLSSFSLCISRKQTFSLGFRICGLPIQPITRTGQADPEPLEVTPGVSSTLPSILQGQGIHVSNRSPYSNRETGAIQWHLKRNCRIPESMEKEIPIPRTLHPHLKWWTQGENVLPGQPLHPMLHAIQGLYRRLKRRLECSLR